MAQPSKVVVPLPNSSIKTKLCLVAHFKIILVSASSTKKVDSFSKMLSEAPIRVKILKEKLNSLGNLGKKY